MREQKEAEQTEGNVLQFRNLTVKNIDSNSSGVEINGVQMDTIIMKVDSGKTYTYDSIDGLKEVEQ